MTTLKIIKESEIMKLQRAIVLKSINDHLVNGRTEKAVKLAKMHNIKIHNKPITLITTHKPIMSKELAHKLWGRRDD